MQVYIAADHAGFDAKERLTAFLAALGHTVTDCGAFSKEEGDDYPDFITPCAEKVAADPASFGIILGGSGQGEAMAANRVKGVRAAVYYGEAAHPQTDAAGAALGVIASVRGHNDANILSLGARFLSLEELQNAVASFLTTPFSNAEVHRRRIGKF
jgi:ribose 5-phosphate isomerase B